MGTIANDEIKQLRAIGHRLKPVVTVAGNGVSDGVLTELDRALSDHELIKVRINAGGRAERAAILTEIASRSGAEVVQTIGGVALLLRRSARPDPRLSNLIRGTG